MTTEICERVVHTEALLPHLATKNDITTIEATLLKWFIGTAIGLTSAVTVGLPKSIQSWRYAFPEAGGTVSARPTRASILP